MVIPVFNPTSAGQGGGSSGKRSASGSVLQQANPSTARDSPNVPLVNRTALSKFCNLLCEPQSLSIMLSLFVRLHNIVQDEANLELNCELSSLW